MAECDWEQVDRTHGEETDRLPVPGGWIYRTTKFELEPERNETYTVLAVAMVFVPDAPAGPRKHPVAGKFFHTVHADGRICYQGRVLKTAADGVLVQLFEWFFGAPSCQRFFPWSAVSDWQFYDTDRAMREAYNHRTGSRSEPEDQELPQ